MKTRERRRGGFTLIEVMIVITIILALTGLVAYNVLGRQKQAKADLAKIDLNTIKTALKQFRFDFDRYPKEEEGLKVLWDKTVLSLENEADEAKWHKYLEEPMPTDRWGREWNYRPVSEHGDEDIYDVWSVGADGEEGTDDDVVSWSKEADGTTPSGSDTGKSPG